jgi:integrase
MTFFKGSEPRTPWNKGKLVGQKLPLKPEQIWAIRIHLEMAHKIRDLALFNLALDSKLRGCDIVKLTVKDVSMGDEVKSRSSVLQQKTKQPVKFKITDKTQKALSVWIEKAQLRLIDYLFPSSVCSGYHLSTQQYAKIVNGWVESIGLDKSAYGTHSLRRTKASIIYKQTKNLRAIQILLGHTKLESTVRYLGVEVDDALELSEQIDI